MSIQDKRIKDEVNNIIKRSLQKGYLPTSNEVIGLLSQYMSTSNLDMPTFEFSKFYKNFTLKNLNDAKASTANDLLTVYETVIDLHDKIEKQVNKFETEKKKHNYIVNELEGQLLNLVNKYSANGYIDTIKESIVDMERININSTTCDIDLENKEITLKKLSDIPYSGPMDIKVSALDPIAANGELSKYINTPGSYWQGVITKAVQEETSIEIMLDLKVETIINKIELNMPLIKSGYIAILTSKDMDLWENIFEDSVINTAVANTDIPLRYVKIIISKVEADKFKNNNFEYHFIIDKIKMFKVNYALQSTMVSTPIVFDNNINKVSISDTTIKPASTNIDYYVALNSSNPEWVPIVATNAPSSSDNQIVSFNTVETGAIFDVSLPDGISNEAYELKSLSTNGQHIYSIGEINNVEIISNKLYKGLGAWRVDTIKQQITGAVDKTLFIENPTIIQTSYNPMISGKSSLIINNATFTEPTIKKFTTTLECPNVDQITKGAITSRYPITIYLNGNILYKGTPTTYTTITYPFKAKKNILEVIVNISAAATSVSVDLNTNLYNLSSYIYADPEPLTEVSVFNLRYNTNNQKNVYAIKQTNTGYTILVKDNDLKIHYRLLYDYITEPTNELLVKAVFKREYTSVNLTPKLKGYEVKIM